MTSLTRLPLALAFLLLLPIPVGAEDLSGLWPQWRGPQRDGSVGGEAWPETLACLKASWRVELGPGYPGPIVAQDRVFVAETVDKESEVVRALDRASGKELWRTQWQGSWSVPFFARANGSWIRSTPAYDGGTLYVGGIRELVVALDGADGKERWRLDAPQKFGTKVPDFGFASSPLVWGDHVFVQAANSILKLDKSTGNVTWRALEGQGDIGSSGAFSSPMISSLNGREQLLVQTRLELFGLDPESGSVLWSQPVPHFRGMNILTPVVWKDRIFTSSYRNGSYLYQVNQDEGSFQVDQAWSYKAAGYMSSPVVIQDHVYLHLGNQRFTTIDLETGDSPWTSQPFGKYWSVVHQNDKILALDERGELILARADPKAFEVLDNRKISVDPTWGHLAISGGEIFVRELEAVAAYRWCPTLPASEAQAP